MTDYGTYEVTVRMNAPGDYRFRCTCGWNKTLYVKATEVLGWKKSHLETHDDVPDSEETPRSRAIPATLYVTREDDGTVSGISVSPNEADAGYFGTREPDEFWEAVAEYLYRIARDHPSGDERDSVYPLEWEG